MPLILSASFIRSQNGFGWYGNFTGRSEHLHRAPACSTKVEGDVNSCAHWHPTLGIPAVPRELLQLSSLLYVVSMFVVQKAVFVDKTSLCTLGSCGRVIEAGQVSQVHVVLPCLCCLLPLFRAEVGCGQCGWESAAAILQVGQSTWIQFQPNLSMAFARISNTREFLQFPSLLYLIFFSRLLFNQHSVTLSGVTTLSICVYFSVLEGEGEFSILLFSHHLGPLQKLIFKRLKVYYIVETQNKKVHNIARKIKHGTKMYFLCSTRKQAGMSD